ncbi:MAG: hypothetical protein WA653_02210 [Candidatus Sulfotelmatobacter sp.]
MIQTVLAINGQGCMIGGGNTAEELEAIAVTLLRTAAAIRNREEGAIECIGRDGQTLAYAHVRHCGPACNLEGSAVPTIEHLACMAGDSKTVHAISRSASGKCRRLNVTIASAPHFTAAAMT